VNPADPHPDLWLTPLLEQSQSDRALNTVAPATHLPRESLG
jgi:hypothetical protein